MHAHGRRAQRGDEAQWLVTGALDLVHGVPRNDERLSGSERLLALVQDEHAVAREDNDRLLAVVAVDGGLRARGYRLLPDLETPKALEGTGDRAVRETGELVLLDVVMGDDHLSSCVLLDINTLLYRNCMSTPRAPGRPRDPEVDAAILKSAASLLAEKGYSRMSIETVAANAGVTRPTVYRRFATKADLATAALAHMIDEQPRPSGDLDIEEALTSALAHLARRLRQRNSMALVGTLLVEEERTPELIALFRDRVWDRRASTLREILDRGRERGEIRKDADVEVVVSMLIGSLYAAHLSRARIPRTWPARTVRAALDGMY